VESPISDDAGRIDMTDGGNLALVQQIYAAFGRGDVPAILERLDARVEWDSHYPASIPYGGIWHGHDGFLQFLSHLDSIKLSRFEPQKFVAEADTVVVLGLEQFTVNSTGVECLNEWVHVFTLDQGKVIAVRTYNDTAAVSAAFQPQ
jgi:hypothetical protein